MAEKYGKWINRGKLGKGGQAQTFLVVEEGAEEKGQFVLKRLNPNRIERARKEIEACRKLSHPNVVKMLDDDLTSSKPYLVVEYCQGGDLESSAIHQLEIVDRLKLFAQICRGVGHAHSQGIIHRDLKPANIFLREDKTTPVVGDFGICFLTDEGERITLLDEVAAPRWYGAPELEDGRLDEISPASDVYSLGKLLYWMIAGRIFAREKHRDPQYDLTQTGKDNAFFLIYELLDRCIVFNPSERFKDVNELAQSVEVTLRRVASNAHPINLTAPQQCIYCGIGKYQVVVNQLSNNWEQETYKLQNLGFSAVGECKWIIFICDYCGNMQIFRPDKTKDPYVWKPR